MDDAALVGGSSAPSVHRAMGLLTTFHRPSWRARRFQALQPLDAVVFSVSTDRRTVLDRARCSARGEAGGTGIASSVSPRRPMDRTHVRTRTAQGAAWSHSACGRTGDRDPPTPISPSGQAGIGNRVRPPRQNSRPSFMAGGPRRPESEPRAPSEDRTRDSGCSSRVTALPIGAGGR